MVYSIFPESINLKTLQECVERFERGEVAIIPTDSVYAVAGDFQHPAALKKLAQIRERR
jgi:tRNA A37 threonylcarbamoyladenosine synthetase subunit TsaC/SUA5/YrdC